MQRFLSKATPERFIITWHLGAVGLGHWSDGKRKESWRFKVIWLSEFTLSVREFDWIFFWGRCKQNAAEHEDMYLLYTYSPNSGLRSMRDVVPWPVVERLHGCEWSVGGSKRSWFQSFWTKATEKKTTKTTWSMVSHVPESITNGPGITVDYLYTYTYDSIRL